MKFKTLKSSETGKKFAKVHKRAQEAHEATISLINELGAVQWRQGYWCVFSGVSALIFPENFSVPKHYKIVEGGYLPKLNSKLGKEIDKKLDDLPKISNEELNECIGWKNSFPKQIGVNFSNKDFYLFSVRENWNVTIPDDCEEITTTEWNVLIK